MNSRKYPRTGKSSSGDGPLHYLKPRFIKDNKWWETPGHISIDRNGHVDVFLESTPAAKARLNAWYEKNMDRLGKTRPHNL